MQINYHKSPSISLKWPKWPKLIKMAKMAINQLKCHELAKMAI
jgi:hypothetical protein